MLISSTLGVCWRGNVTTKELSKQGTGFLVLLLFFSLGHRPEQHSGIHNKYSSSVSASNRHDTGPSQTAWLTSWPAPGTQHPLRREWWQPSIIYPYSPAALCKVKAGQSTPYMGVFLISVLVWGTNNPFDQIFEMDFCYRSSCICEAQQRLGRHGRYHTQIHPPQNLARGWRVIHLLTHTVSFNKPPIIFWLKQSNCMQ